VYRGDGPAVVGLVGGSPSPADSLQLIGDGLLAALVQQVPGAAAAAAACSEALRARDWEGDPELADQLGTAVTGGTSRLRPLAVDLEELADVLEGDPADGGGRVSLETGEVWHASAIEYAREMGEEDEDESDDPERWLWVESEGSRAGYRDMERFIETVADPGRADRLGIAIEGRGAFRRFKDVLGRWPDEQERWYAFSEERKRGRARAWLADGGYAVAPPAEPRRGG